VTVGCSIRGRPLGNAPGITAVPLRRDEHTRTRRPLAASALDGFRKTVSIIVAAMIICQSPDSHHPHAVLLYRPVQASQDKDQRYSEK
jgi:hypothetical protein